MTHRQFHFTSLDLASFTIEHGQVLGSLKTTVLPGDTIFIDSFHSRLRGRFSEHATWITVSQGANQSATVRMVRGGAVQVTVGSYDNIPGTRNVQAKMPWRFLNFSIPIKARVYFYDNLSRTIGYSEVDLVEGKDNVTLYTFLVNFAGQNWSLREIWFYGDLPTHFSYGNYTLRGYTLGYVQQKPISFPENLCSVALSFMILLYGNEIDLITPIFQSPSLFGQVLSTHTLSVRRTRRLQLLLLELSQPMSRRRQLPSIFPYSASAPLS